MRRDHHHMQNLKTLLSCLWIIKSDIWWIISSLISLLSETGFCLLITCIISWRDGNELLSGSWKCCSMNGAMGYLYLGKLEKTSKLYDITDVY